MFKGLISPGLAESIHNKMKLQNYGDYVFLQTSFFPIGTKKCKNGRDR